jgi:hypothetical protein
MWEHDYLLNLAESTAFTGVAISKPSSLKDIIFFMFKLLLFSSKELRLLFNFLPPSHYSTLTL